ncbi:MAG: type II toxin-antitoxin system RelE/ParE family toxin [Methyloceanibacter sp.]
MAEANKKLVWAPKAKQDLRNIWDYFARVASAEIADKILHEIDQSASRLSSRPYLGRPRDEVMPGLRGVLVQPHTVFYRITNSNVEIVRVLHERRDFAAALREDER